MNKLTVFEERNILGKEFKIYGDVENPLFLAKDVATWIEHANVTLMTESVDEEEKKLDYVIDTSGQKRKSTFLTEDGLYEVLMLSRKPVAKEFKKHVKEILKSIRKNGMYATDITIEKMLNDPDFAIQLLTNLKAEKEKRVKAERKNAILMHTNNVYSCTEIAKELNMTSANALNKRMEELKIQYKTKVEGKNTWVLYAGYSNRGYTEIKQTILDSGNSVYSRYFTQLGREFILNLFAQTSIELI